MKPGKIILSRSSSVYTNADKCVVDMQALVDREAEKVG